MLSENDIRKIFEERGVLKQFGVKKEIKDLPEHIDDQGGEIILYACDGLTDGNTWLMVCTNKKLLFLDKGMIYGLKKIEIPIKKINSTSFKSGIVLGRIIIYHGSSSITVDNIDKSALQPMVDAINSALKKIEENQFSFNNNIQPISDDKLNTIIEQNHTIIKFLKEISEKL